MVSVATSRRPMALYGMPFFSMNWLTADRQIELISSRSVTKARADWPRPTVYLPAETLSCCSKAVCATY